MTRYRHTETLTWEDDNPDVVVLHDLLLQLIRTRRAGVDVKVLGTWERVIGQWWCRAERDQSKVVRS